MHGCLIFFLIQVFSWMDVCRDGVIVSRVLGTKISELVGVLVGLVIVEMLFSLFKSFQNGCLHDSMGIVLV